jgi:hypothetical protein
VWDSWPQSGSFNFTPCHSGLATKQFVQRHVEPFDRKVTIHADCDERFDKSPNILVLRDPSPVETGDFVVLAIAVVVAALGAPVTSPAEAELQRHYL